MSFRCRLGTLSSQTLGAHSGVAWYIISGSLYRRGPCHPADSRTLAGTQGDSHPACTRIRDPRPCTMVGHRQGQRSTIDRGRTFTSIDSCTQVLHIQGIRHRDTEFSCSLSMQPVLLLQCRQPRSSWCRFAKFHCMCVATQPSASVYSSSLQYLAVASYSFRTVVFEPASTCHL